MQRLISASLIFLLLGAGSAGVIGLTSAGDDLSDGSFHITAPRVGDRGAYTMGQYELPRSGADAAGLTPVSDRYTGNFSFEWREDRHLVDPDGLPRIVHTIGYEDTSRNGPHHGEEEEWPTRYSLLIDAANGEAVGELEEWFIREPGEDVLGNEIERRSDSWSILFFTSPYRAIDALLCGVDHGLQGKTVGPGDRAGPVFACTAGPHWSEDPSTYAWEVIGVQEGETPLLEVRLAHGKTTVGRIWHAEGVSVPVRIELGGQDASQRRFVAELVSFEAGEGPPLGDEIVRSGPIMTEVAPRTPWMFEEGAIDHPFPASEAYQAALRDASTGLADYLAEHPDAYITDASYWDYDTKRTVPDKRQEWRLAFRDETTIHHVHIGKREVAEGQGDALLDLVASVTGEETGPYYTFSASTRDLDDYGPMAVLPERLPTVESMWRFYEGLASTSAKQAGPNMWEWTILCCGSDDEVRFLIQAGRFQDRQGTAGDGSERDWSYLAYEYQDDTRPYSYSERGFAEVQVDGAGGQEAYELQQAPHVRWSVPVGPTAAAAGAAFIVALLYYLWPSLKVSLLGLFSRLQPETALEHPVRRLLVDRVEAEPGIHFQALRRATGTGRGALTHHLRHLERTGHLVAKDSQGYRCYFPKGRVDAKAMAASGATRSRTAKDILAAIRTRPGIRGVDLAKELGVTQPTITHHLKRLRRAGLVDDGPTGLRAP